VIGEEKAMNIETLYPQVKAIVADVLAIDESEVELNKSLVGDLDAESIDFLDLVFRLEKEFKVKIPRGQIEKSVRGSLSEGEFEQGGVLTEAGMRALREHLSEVPEERFSANMKVEQIPMLFTVETLCKLVLSAQESNSATAA
jgi:acyl carrier protein